MALRASLELMLARGQDSPLLRYSLGTTCLKEGDLVGAIDHLRQAVAQDPRYSAAWKALGAAHADAGSTDRAIEVYRAGITAAEANGDVQAAREMGVFLRRLEREPGN